MAGKMEWAVVRCMDGRINPHVNDSVLKYGIPVEHDLISLSGGCGELINPDSRPSTDLSNVSLTLHGTERVLMIQHTDCGAYGGRAACGGTEEADRMFHLNEIQNSMLAVHQRHPALKITAILIHILDNGAATIEEVTL